jgi:hypothetical protein
MTTKTPGPAAQIREALLARYPGAYLGRSYFSARKDGTSRVKFYDVTTQDRSHAHLGKRNAPFTEVGITLALAKLDLLKYGFSVGLRANGRGVISIFVEYVTEDGAAVDSLLAARRAAKLTAKAVKAAEHRAMLKTMGLTTEQYQTFLRLQQQASQIGYQLVRVR